MKDLSQHLSNLSPKRRSILLRRLQRISPAERPDAIIPQQDRTRSFPLSFSQHRLWFLDQLEPGNPTHNVPIAARLKIALDVDAFTQSVNHVVSRHEILRTSFTVQGDQPVQIIAPALSIPVPVVELQHLPESERKFRTDALVAEHARQRFDLARGPLLRVTLVQLGQEDYLLLLGMHHIISDGWSVGIFIRELLTLYQAFCSGQPISLPELPIQFADFAVWQREWLNGETLHQQLEYWKRQLDGRKQLIKLPTDRPRPRIERFRGATLQFELSETRTRGLSDLSRQQDVTIFMTLLAAFQVLLYRYSKQTDILVGTPIASRNRIEIEGLIGFFVNTLVLRTNLSGNPSFIELLGRVRKVTLEGYAHQDVPFEKLVEVLQPERSLSHNPIFQVMFTFLNEPTRRQLQIADLDWSVLDIDRGMANRDLTLRMEEVGQKLVGHFEYNTDLFDESTITSMAARFEALLAALVAQPEARIDSFELLSPEEQKTKAATNQQRAAISRRTFKQFLSAKPQAISTEHQNWIGSRFLEPGHKLPLVIEPKIPDMDLIVWARKNRAFIETNLMKHGCILFRRFAVASVFEFEQFAAATSDLLMDYEERSTPRSPIEGKVYTSTEYPSDQLIMLHNEMSYSHKWPLKLWFFCAQAATQGGATPVADSRIVFENLDPEIRKEFISKRVMYVRNYGYEMDLPWQDVFQTRERAQVEEYCRHSGIEFKWKDGDRLQTRQIRHAIAHHPKIGDIVWFNSAHMFHISALDEPVRESLLSLFPEDELPRNVYYGDGSPIEAEVIEHIRSTYQQAAVSFPWRQGDVLMLDNMLAAHGRAPFAGPRKIMVAMADPHTIEAETVVSAS